MTAWCVIEGTHVIELWATREQAEAAMQGPAFRGLALHVAEWVVMGS